MLKIINDLINKYAKRIVLVLVVLTAIIHASFYIGALANGSKDVRYLQLVNFIIHLFSIAIIIIWIYVWKRFRDRLFGLGNSFKNDNQYKTIYNRYKKRFERKNLEIGYWIYMIVWLVGTGFIVIYSCVYVLKLNILSIWSIVLFTVTMLLNNISYYDCVSFVRMLFELSEINPRKIIHLTHNRFQPSSSWGLQRLISNVKLFSEIFLLVSLLYTIEGSIVVLYGYFHGALKTGMETQVLLFYVYILLVLLLGIGTFVALIVIPYYCIKRIYDKWKERSLLDFELKMLQIDKTIKTNHSLSIKKKQELILKRDRYVDYIVALTKDRLPLKINVFQIVIALSTILANAATILTFIVVKK